MNYRYDVQLFIENCRMNETAFRERMLQHVTGENPVVSGDSTRMKIRLFTNEPWELLRICAEAGAIYNIVIINRERTSQGLIG